MKKFFFTCSILAGIIAFSACSKKSSAPSNSASVMFVNGCAGTTGVAVKANTASISSDILFGQNSGYQYVTAGAESIAFTLTDGTPLDTGTSSLTANAHYSVFTSGLITNSSVVVTADDLTAPTSGNAKVRFVNLCPDNFSVNCYLGTSTLDSNLSYKGASAFIQIPATTGTVLLQNPAAPVDQASLSAQQFAAGKIYTVMLTGSSQATTGNSVMTLTVIANN